MALDIGINVIEVDGSASPSITGAATSVAGFNILTQRGVPNRPVRVTSFPQFVERFGGYFGGGKGAYLVRGFFDNGGRVAYVNRVADAAAEPATTSLQSAGNRDTLAVTAGFRGEEDPGAWGRGLYVHVRHSSSAVSKLVEEPASVSADAPLGETTDMSALQPLTVAVDGGEAEEIPFFADEFAVEAKKAKRHEIVSAINRKTRLLRASLAEDSKLVLTSTGERAADRNEPTRLQVTKAHNKLNLGASAAATTGKVDAPEKGGARLAAPGNFTPGDAVVVSGPGTEGATITTDVTLVSVKLDTGAVTWRPDIDPAKYTDASQITVATAEFDLLVAQGAPDEDHLVETHSGLSMQPRLDNYALARVNHSLTGSRFVVLDDIPAGGAERPQTMDDATWVGLANGGTDGSPTRFHVVGDPAKQTGLSAFDPHAIQLLCCDLDDQVARDALAYCEGRGDAMYVGALPYHAILDLDKAIEYGVKLQAKKVYGALYGPWIRVPDPIGVGDNPRIDIPPTGHVMGVYSRIETTRGIWKAPAGDEANLRGVLDVERNLSDADHTALVTMGAVNGIRAVPRSGIVVDASRTLSSDPRWRYVNVRLLFNYVKSSLRDGLRWARQEPNRDTLWRSIRVSTVTPFLLGLWRQGAFGTGTPEQTFTVIVDETNNPPDAVQQGLLTVEVYFYPSLPAETIKIVVGQQPSGASVSEA